LGEGIRNLFGTVQSPPPGGFTLTASFKKSHQMVVLETPPQKKQPGSEVMRQHCEKNIHDENNDILKIKFNLFHKK